MLRNLFSLETYKSKPSSEQLLMRKAIYIRKFEGPVAVKNGQDTYKSVYESINVKVSHIVNNWGRDRVDLPFMQAAISEKHKNERSTSDSVLNLHSVLEDTHQSDEYIDAITQPTVVPNDLSAIGTLPPSIHEPSASERLDRQAAARDKISSAENPTFHSEFNGGAETELTLV